MNQQSQIRKNRGLKGLIITLFLVGTVLLLLPFVKRALLSYRIESVTIKQTQAVPTNEVSQGTAVIQPPTLSETLALYRHQPEASIGRLVIPSVNIDVALFPTLINENLLLGAVAMFPERDPETDNMVFISHHLWNESLLFGPLIGAKSGQAIFMSYGDQVYRYEINEIKTVEATEISVMDNQQGEITLITCDRPTLTNQRLVVKGLVKEMATEEIKQEINQETKQTERNVTKHRLFMRHFGWIIVSMFIIMLILAWIVIKL